MWRTLSDDTWIFMLKTICSLNFVWNSSVVCTLYCYKVVGDERRRWKLTCLMCVNGSTHWNFSLNQKKNFFSDIGSWKMCIVMPVWRNPCDCYGIPNFEMAESCKSTIGARVTALNKETINTSGSLITTDPHLTTRQLAQILGISLSRMRTILRKELHILRMCTYQIPHLLLIPE